MATLIQLSDLHFGPLHNSHLDEIILQDIAALDPDVVVVSGDFTMRARYAEFEQARDFLSRINKPTLAIPGNHDQPILRLADWIERFAHQYSRYQKHIHTDIDSMLVVPGWFIVGLNDNHPIAPGGFWSVKQRTWIQDQMVCAPDECVKVVVTHHQLSWGGKWRPAGFWYPTRALDLLARNGVELVLNGHTHVPLAEQTAQGIVIARAGTATSGRLRHGNSNSYNFIWADSKQISVFVRRYYEKTDTFVSDRAFTFPRRNNRP
ncbi:MAG: metallophosphoesterase [Chloroflexi bacterium]|nr:metallophosphoesterase [Chloroflexota bacterium]